MKITPKIARNSLKHGYISWTDESPEKPFEINA